MYNMRNVYILFIKCDAHGGVLRVVALAGEPGLRARELRRVLIGEGEEPRDAVRDRLRLDRAMVRSRCGHCRRSRRLLGGRSAPRGGWFRDPGNVWESASTNDKSS